MKKLFQRKFSSIKTRCTNPNTFAFKYYGGRGIKCEWSSWEHFMEEMIESYLIALKKFPGDKITIERNDVDGNYCKENCSWIPSKEQPKNRRNTIQLTFGGKTQNVSDWARELNFKPLTLLQRVRRGFSLEEILFKKAEHYTGSLPVMILNPKTGDCQEFDSFNEASNWLGINSSTISRSLNRQKVMRNGYVAVHV